MMSEWHQSNICDVLQHLGSDAAGLGDTEGARRLSEYGPN
jgi:hypothetical protein